MHSTLAMAHIIKITATANAHKPYLTSILAIPPRFTETTSNATFTEWHHGRLQFALGKRRLKPANVPGKAGRLKPQTSRMMLPHIKVP
jgi:hypothetical protein